VSRSLRHISEERLQFFLCSLFLKTSKIYQLKYNKVDHRIHFISGANSYMFRHQIVIIREFINNKDP